jgi:hypothetical protein
MRSSKQAASEYLPNGSLWIGSAVLGLLAIVFVRMSPKRVEHIEKKAQKTADALIAELEQEEMKEKKKVCQFYRVGMHFLFINQSRSKPNSELTMIEGYF